MAYLFTKKRARINIFEVNKTQDKYYQSQKVRSLNTSLKSSPSFGTSHYGYPFSSNSYSQSTNINK